MIYFVKQSKRNISRGVHVLGVCALCARQKRGFTLLFSMLVAALVTSIGLALFSIAQKEIILSGVSRESQFAFYAADSGAECALFLNFYYDAFATSTSFNDANKAKCDGKLIIKPASGPNPLSNPEKLGGQDTTEFKYDMKGKSPYNNNDKDYCVMVQVKKYYQLDPDPDYPTDPTKSVSHLHTDIKSLGYNTKCSKISSIKPEKLIERAIELNL